SKPATIVGHDAIAARCEGGQLILPHATAAGCRMHEHHWGAAATGVRVPQTHSWHVGSTLTCSCLCQRRHEAGGHQPHDDDECGAVHLHPCLMCSVDRSFSLQMNSIINEPQARS